MSRHINIDFRAGFTKVNISTTKTDDREACPDIILPSVLVVAVIITVATVISTVMV